MSLKENIEYIKQEVSAEESFMEKFFKLEKFYKKYKVALTVVLSIFIVSLVGYYTTSYINDQNKLQANIAFNKLLINKNDTQAQAVLKESNIKLYNIFQYMNDNTKKVDNQFLEQISNYAKAIKANNIDKIVEVSQNQSFLLKDFATINTIILKIKNKKYQDAKETLKLVSNDQNIASLKLMLEHFLLNK
jgi:hypothetical protein